MSDDSFARGPWGSAVRLMPDVWRIRLKNTRGHLAVNTYVYRGGGVLAIIDPGWPWTLDLLTQALGALGITDTLADVDVFLYTHTHIDHMGAAALLEDMSSAPHWCMASVADQLPRWHDFQDELADWSPWASRVFAEPQRTEIVQRMEGRRVDGTANLIGQIYGAGAVTRFELFAPGDVLALGALSLQVIATPGHDPHHVAFWEPERRLLFSGDVVLPVPTPISQAMGDDLTTYEHSLRRLSHLDPEWLFPGHGSQVPASEVRRAFERSTGFVTMHRRGIEKVFAAAPGPMDLYSIALALTPDGQPFVPRTRWVVHLALTSSHLQQLTDAGELEQVAGPRWVRA